jgi:hypothetical protein
MDGLMDLYRKIPLPRRREISPRVVGKLWFATGLIGFHNAQGVKVKVMLPVSQYVLVSSSLWDE